MNMVLIKTLLSPTNAPPTYPEVLERNRQFSNKEHPSDFTALT